MDDKIYKLPQHYEVTNQLMRLIRTQSKEVAGVLGAHIAKMETACKNCEDAVDEFPDDLRDTIRGIIKSARDLNDAKRRLMATVSSSEQLASFDPPSGPVTKPSPTKLN